MKELTINAVLENAEQAADFVSEHLEKTGCPEKARIQIAVAIDEIFSNIARFAYYPSEGPVTLRIETMKDPAAVLLTFIDHGKPYNPLIKEDPDINMSVEERQLGGLGIFLVKKTMDEITYEYKNEENILVIRKNLA